MGKKKKNYYYRYLRKRLRNLKVSEILRICHHQLQHDGVCETCPIEKYGVCIPSVDYSSLNKKIYVRFVYHLKKKDD